MKKLFPVTEGLDPNVDTDRDSDSSGDQPDRVMKRTDPAQEEGQVPTKPQRPAIVTRATWMLYFCVALSIPFLFLSWPAIARRLPPHLTNIAAFFLVLVGVIIPLWVTYRISKGTNWARILYLVLYVIGAPVVFFSLLLTMTEPDGGGIRAIAGGLQLVVPLVAFFDLFRRESRPWFHQSR